MRLSTWSGQLLQDHEVIPNSCNFFKILCMKQVGSLPRGGASMSSICADTAALGNMSAQDAKHLDKLMMKPCSLITQLPMGWDSPEFYIEKILDEDNHITVDISGTAMVVTPVYKDPLVVNTPDGNKGINILGVLYQHSNTHKQCNLKFGGVDPTQVDFACPVGFIDVQR